jgi:hypothetical protein
MKKQASPESPEYPATPVAHPAMIERKVRLQPKGKYHPIPVSQQIFAQEDQSLPIIDRSAVVFQFIWGKKINW